MSINKNTIYNDDMISKVCVYGEGGGWGGSEFRSVQGPLKGSGRTMK